MSTETSALFREVAKPPRFPRRTWWQTNSPRIIVALLALDIFCLSMAGSLSIVPITRILEDILCHLYYDKHSGQNGDIDESLCKIDAIQSELAYLLGLNSMVEAVVGM